MDDELTPELLSLLELVIRPEYYELMRRMVAVFVAEDQAIMNMPKAKIVCNKR